MSDDLTNKRLIKMLQDKAKDLPQAHIPQAVAEVFARCTARRAPFSNTTGLRTFNNG